MTESTAFMRNLRPRGTLPRPQRTNRARPITIKHPGYALAEDLLCFPAYDGTSVPGLWGCSHLLVLDACRIIANNRDGFLSKTPRRSGRISTGERTLTASVYYYFLDDDRDAQYPVNARFDTWSFPDRLPTHWLSSRAVPSTSRRNHGTSESDVSASLQIVGDTCVLSGERRGTDPSSLYNATVAHVLSCQVSRGKTHTSFLRSKGSGSLATRCGCTALIRDSALSTIPPTLSVCTPSSWTSSIDTPSSSFPPNAAPKVSMSHTSSSLNTHTPRASIE